MLGPHDHERGLTGSHSQAWRSGRPKPTRLDYISRWTGLRLTGHVGMAEESESCIHVSQKPRLRETLTLTWLSVKSKTRLNLFIRIDNSVSVYHIVYFYLKPLERMQHSVTLSAKHTNANRCDSVLSVFQSRLSVWVGIAFSIRTTAQRTSFVFAVS